MRLLLLLSIAAMAISFQNSKPIFSRSLHSNDSVINHVLDGSVREWPLQKFETDKGTEIKYAADNDANNLYLAMLIPKFGTQAKIMRNGMKLYIDLKGKKREAKGVEFPVVITQGNFSGGERFSKQAFRTNLSANLLFLKIIGSNDDEQAVKQEISQEGSVNIQYTWDSSEVMSIEYKIPFTIIGDKPLNEKTISFGWKINGAEPVIVSRTIETVAVPSGSRPPQTQGRNSGSSIGHPTFDQRPDIAKEQSFWTKYTVSLSAK
jgi:hypothetical protein